MTTCTLSGMRGECMQGEWVQSWGWRRAVELILLPGSRPSCQECICSPEEWGMHTDTVSSTKPFRCHSHILLLPGLTVMTNRENTVCQHWQGSVCSGTGLCLYGREVCVLFFLKLVGEYWGSYPRNQCGLLVTFLICSGKLATDL